MKNQPLFILICWHLWRPEWWHQKMCWQCTYWTKALMSGMVSEAKEDAAYKDGYNDGYAHGVTSERA